MTQDLFPKQWLLNTLLDDGFIAQIKIELLAKPLPYDLAGWLTTHKHLYRPLANPTRLGPSSARNLNP